MADKNLPNIPIYIGDWERDCNVLSLEAEMAWMKIIFKMHLSGKQSRYKVSAKGLQRLWKSNANEVQEILEELKFEDICEITEVAGGYEFFCRRLEKENELSKVRSKAAKNRWNKDSSNAKPKQTKSKKVQNTDNDIDYDNESENENEEKEVSKGEKIEFEKIVSIFNSLCKNLPNVQKITDKRKSAIKARAEEYSLSEIGTVFQHVSQSAFLNGDNDRGWTADFDWVMNPNNFIKILEGKYNGKGKQQAAGKSKVNYSDDFKRRLAEKMGA